MPYTCRNSSLTCLYGIVNAEIEKVIYPLCDDIKVDSRFIRNWWENQSFDLMNMSQSDNSSDSYNLFNREADTGSSPVFQKLHGRYLIADIGKHLVVDLKKMIIY